MEEAQAIFIEMASQDDIAFKYPNNGCYARAHIMGERMLDDKIVPGKVWIEGNLNVNTIYDYEGNGEKTRK